MPVTLRSQKFDFNAKENDHFTLDMFTTALSSGFAFRAVEQLRSLILKHSGIMTIIPREKPSP